MSERWRTISVSELGKIVTGKTPKTSVEEYFGGEIPFLTPSDDMESKWVNKTARSLTEKGLEKVKNNLIPAKSVCVSCIGSDLGKVTMTTRSTVTNQQINSIIVDELNFDADFVYYSMKQLGKILNFHSKTSTAVPIVNKSTFSQYEISAPDIDEQRRISSILCMIDNKIENNKKINNNLSQQTQAIFQHYFGGGNNSVPGYISDITINVTDGVHNTVKDDSLGKYLLLSCKNIKGGVLSIGSTERKISEETFLKLRKRTKLEKGDILISSVGTIGEILMLKEIPSNYEFQRSVAMIKPNPEKASSAYIYEALIAKRAELINTAHGAVQQCLFISDISGFEIGVPDVSIMKTFTEIVEPFYTLISEHDKENRHLVALRDSLLPKLMSGEIDVSDIDL